MTYFISLPFHSGAALADNSGKVRVWHLLGPLSAQRVAPPINRDPGFPQEEIFKPVICYNARG